MLEIVGRVQTDDILCLHDNSKLFVIIDVACEALGIIGTLDGREHKRNTKHYFEQRAQTFCMTTWKTCSCNLSLILAIYDRYLMKFKTKSAAWQIMSYCTHTSLLFSVIDDKFWIVLKISAKRMVDYVYRF